MIADTGAVLTDETAVGFFERHEAVFDQETLRLRAKFDPLKVTSLALPKLGGTKI
jgi:hypothetical protein